MRIHALALAPLLALTLVACQPGGTPGALSQPDATDVAPRVAAASDGRTGFDRRTCQQLGTFAIAIADGRRNGISRQEALASATAGPLTPLFRTIVNGVYDAPRPTNAVDWEELRRAYAVRTTRSCIAAATGESPPVVTRG